MRNFSEISSDFCKDSITYARQAVDDYVLGRVSEFSDPPNPPKIPEDSLDFIYFSIFDFRARYGFDLQKLKKRVARQQVRNPQVFKKFFM